MTCQVSFILYLEHLYIFVSIYLYINLLASSNYQAPHSFRRHTDKYLNLLLSSITTATSNPIEISTLTNTLLSTMAAANFKYACSLENDAIKIFSTAPATCGNASLTIEFMRMIKVPENSPAAKLPSGLGKFPLFKISDYVDKLPSQTWVDRGVFFPMHGE